MATRDDEATPTVVTVQQGEESAELLADAIIRLADAADALLGAGLTKRAIVVLLQDRTVNLGKREIQTVLEALPDLRFYVRGRD